MKTNKCTKCGSDKIEAGALEGVAVRPDRTSTLKKVFNTGGLVRCSICLSCGALFDFNGDPEALSKMVE